MIIYQACQSSAVVCRQTVVISCSLACDKQNCQLDPGLSQDEQPWSFISMEEFGILNTLPHYCGPCLCIRSYLYIPDKSRCALKGFAAKTLCDSQTLSVTLSSWFSKLFIVVTSCFFLLYWLFP